MKQHINENNGKTFLFITVPEDAADISNAKKFGANSKLYGTTQGKRKLLYEAQGNWQIIGKGNELKEEQAEEITPCIYDDTPIEEDTDADMERGKIYECFDNSDFICFGPIESLNSLLRSLSLSPQTTLILQQI
jgi:hypothetical protein